MRLLLLVAVASAIGTSTVCAYPQQYHRKLAYVGPSDTLSADSLQLLYYWIDQLSAFDLPKWRESYIYKNRQQPCNQNKQILLYIEERMKVVK